MGEPIGGGGGGPERSRVDVDSLNSIDDLRKHPKLIVDAVRRFAISLTGDFDTAENLAQDTYMRALSNPEGFRPEKYPDGKLMSWLCRICQNLNYDRLRRDKVRARVTRPLDVSEIPNIENLGPTDPSSSEEDKVVGKIDAMRSAELLNQVPEDFRRPLLMHEVEGLSYKEVAAALGIPVGTVMSRIARARRQLRQLMGTPGEER